MKERERAVELFFKSLVLTTRTNCHIVMKNFSIVVSASFLDSYNQKREEVSEIGIADLPRPPLEV